MLRVLGVCALFIALALARGWEEPAAATSYTITGTYTEGCIGTCKCPVASHEMTGSFTLSSLSAGLLLQDIKVSVPELSRTLSGVGVLHQNTSAPQPMQVWSISPYLITLKTYNSDSLISIVLSVIVSP